MNSLKKGEEIPLLNFEGGPGVPLLNFEGGPGVSLLNFRGVPGTTFKPWRGSLVPRSCVPLLHRANLSIHKNISKGRYQRLSCYINNTAIFSKIFEQEGKFERKRDGDDDDNDGGDNEFFMHNGWTTKDVKSYIQLKHLLEILTIANLWHPMSWIWICAESEFRLCRFKLCSSDNHYTTVLQISSPYWGRHCTKIRMWQIWSKYCILSKWLNCLVNQWGS